MPPARRTATKKTASKRVVQGKVVDPPRDRQEKTAPAAPTVIKVTVRDREWTVAEDALDDWELLDDLNAADQGDVTKLPSILRRFLGDDQYPEAMELLRDKATKRVTAENGSAFFWELMEALNPNSSRSSD